MSHAKFHTSVPVIIYIFPLLHWLSACQFDPSGLPDTGTHANNANNGSNPCDSVDCGEHGTCVIAGGAATCQCDTGYIYDGSTCREMHTDPCDGVDCDGHGTCVVTEGHAECRCDTGYTSDGTHCVADTTDPCDGVDCDGHGKCTSEGGTARCECDPGYTTPPNDLLSCVEANRCRSNNDCGPGMVCSVEGRCITTRCGWPTDQSGNTVRNAYESCVPSDITQCEYCNGGPDTCSDAQCLRCAAGLVCVRFGEPLNPHYPEATGICMPVCDPCDNDSCAQGQECFALPSGGGVCLDGNVLVSEGEMCAQGSSMSNDGEGFYKPEEFVECVEGLECVYDGSYINVREWYCRKPCTPGTALTSDYYQASTSSDCDDGEVCAGFYLTEDGIVHGECTPGELETEEGHLCGYDMIMGTETYCAAPLVCDSDFLTCSY